MALVAKTPREAFHIFRDHINHTLNTVLTDYRLQLDILNKKQGPAFLHFKSRNNERIAVPISSPWYLYLGQVLQTAPERNSYRLLTVQYAYRVQRTSPISDEADVRFEYLSPRLAATDNQYCSNHVQFHRDYQDVRDGFSPNKLHIPTGWVTIENVIRFLIADLDVKPRISTWDEELRKSEKQFREWTGRDIPES